MINQTYWRSSAVYGNATHNVWGIVPRAYVGQRLTIHNAVVLHFKPLYGIDVGNYVVVNLCNGVFTNQFEAFLHDTVDVCSQLSFVIREKRVAAAACQSAFLTDDGAGDDLHPETLICHHATDNGNLLEILFSEVSTVRIHVGEQLADNLAYTIEMSWTEDTFHDTVCGRIAELAGVGFRVDLAYGWGKGDGGTYLFQ